jgi:beta-RFAP synthase
MIRVRSPSRLHFGFLSFMFGDHWQNLLGEPAIPARHFGGVGLMIQEPGIRLTLEPAQAWQAEGPLAGRALDYARRFAVNCPGHRVEPQRIVVESTPPEHVGLGTGTQLGLAVARGLAAASGLRDIDAISLAHTVGRGARSAVGIHGFAKGGFLVEAGKKSSADIGHLVARVEFPESWRIVLIVPSQTPGTHGAKEVDAFRSLQLRESAHTLTENLCRLVLLGMLPALRGQDFSTFSESLFDFNLRVGDAFSFIQNGRYGGPRAEAIISFLRRNGVRGVGQSSWGPTLFALTEDQDQATDLTRRLEKEFSLDENELLVTAACNLGAGVGEL